MVVVLEAKDDEELSKALVAAGVEGATRVAATGYGSRALGVGTAEGKGYGIIVVFSCKSTGLRVLPEGDHTKAILMP